jgi:anaerobic magnesium-protoporphyrin IX monomethyl ester cyclase
MSEENVLLIFPPSSWGSIDAFAQPLGILGLATILKQEGIDVSVIDLAALGWYPDKFVDFIKKGSFTHVGITVLTRLRETCYQILQMVKKINPKITILAGGPHVTHVKQEIFSECPSIDIAVGGEADLDIVEIIRNPTKKFYDLGYVKDIRSLPIPDRSLIRHINYDRLQSIWIGDSASMKWDRGCPWRQCRFCSRPALNMAYRRRDPNEIIKEIAIIQNDLKYKNLIIMDDDLHLKSRFTKKILRLKIKEGLDIPFWILTRAEHVDEEGVRLMRQANGTGFIIGLESIVPRVIDMYKKASGDPHKWRETIDRVIDLANKYNLITIASFIIGAPSETAEEIQATIDYCRTAKVDIVTVNPFRFAYKSDFWKEAIQKGQLSPDQFDVFNDKCFGTTQYSKQELFKRAIETQHLISSPLLNPKRYYRIGQKLIKQRNPLLRRNIMRLPLLVKNLYDLGYRKLRKKGTLQNFYEHPYKSPYALNEQIIKPN